MPKRDGSLVTGESLPHTKHLKTNATGFLLRVEHNDLWGLAYEQLAAKDQSLVRNYERLLELAVEGFESVDTDIQERVRTFINVKRQQVV
jgi:hypothetical protein